METDRTDATDALTPVSARTATTDGPGDTHDEALRLTRPARHDSSGRQVMVRFGTLVLRLPRYGRLAFRLSKDSRLTPAQRALVLGGAAYVLSPIDPIPGFIPVVGQLDCLAVVLLSLRSVLRRCRPEVAAEHLEATGLSLATIDADLATVRATAIWVARGVGRTVSRVAAGLLGAGRRAAGSPRLGPAVGAASAVGDAGR